MLWDIPKLSDLKQLNFIIFMSLWVVLLRLTHGAAFSWWTFCDMGSAELLLHVVLHPRYLYGMAVSRWYSKRPSLGAEVFIKLLFTFDLLRCHWPQVMWPSPESGWSGNTQRHGHREVWFTVCYYYKNLLQFSIDRIVKKLC